MKVEVFFSVIVPSYQGERKIGNLIESLLLQDFKDFELILVIDGSTDNTLALAENELSKSNLNYSILQKPNSGRGSTRNFGAKHAKGEFLVFFDDDMVLEPDCLSAHLSFHQHHPNSMAVGRHLENVKWMRTDFQIYKAFISKFWEGALTDDVKRYTKENLHLSAANFSVSKYCFTSLEGFDERLSDLEDFELATRAFDSEIPICYLQNAKAWHHDLITCRSYINRQQQYNRAFQNLYKIRPDLVDRFAQTSGTKITLGTKAFYWIFSFAFWHKWIDKEVFIIKMLPTAIRYKLYDFVVWSQGRIFVV